MNVPSGSTPSSNQASPSNEVSSSELPSASSGPLSTSGAAQNLAGVQQQSTESTTIARAEGKEEGDDVERGSNSTSQDKGKRRAVDQDRTEAGAGVEDLARALAGFTIPKQGALLRSQVSA